MPRLFAAGSAPDVRLVPIDDETKLGDCENLRRRSTRFVGSPMWMIGLAYVNREFVSAYGIYYGNTLVGLVLLNETTCYKIGEMIIGDRFQRRGYGTAAVRAIVQRWYAQRKFPEASLAVHRDNRIAIQMYRRCGFVPAGSAPWDANFLVMKYRL